jgi:hypothetical protein
LDLATLRKGLTRSRRNRGGDRKKLLRL